MSFEKEEIITYKNAIFQAMDSILAEKENSIILGQGVTDPTSIFGTTKGLAEKYGESRVIDMPIMEEGMTGIGVGAALNGIYSIQTHIRVDFLILASNQLINMAAKYKYMFDGSFEVPMLIRAVVGRSWGQGPQHSQSLQSLFGHIPGLTVIMPSNANDALDGYIYAAKNHKGPVISIEHRLLYDLSFYRHKTENYSFQTKIVQSGDSVTIVASSYMVQEAQRAADWVKEKHNISCEIIDVFNISNIDHDLIFTSIQKTGRLIVADTSWLPYGVCAEVSRGVLERDPSILKKKVINLGLQHTPTPTSHKLEKHFYPDMGSLVDSIYKLVFNESHKESIPNEVYIKGLQSKFKGPF
ncbi:MAG: alpha-ketoacid dehydrogenase subunit beta [Leptospiraceae bacterium]|nr:alpha-ketoacid dehydrogenase subunit beta [Leptospiraceae bacterium]